MFTSLQGRGKSTWDFRTGEAAAITFQVPTVEPKTDDSGRGLDHCKSDGGTAAASVLNSVARVNMLGSWAGRLRAVVCLFGHSLILGKLVER